MIVTEHVEEYINSMEKDLPEYLAELEEYANENGVPIIRRSMQTFLRFLLKNEKPKRILEIGAAIGFSSLYMKEYAPADCRITTIEKVEMRLVQARKNLSGHEGIRLIEGDATEVLHELAERAEAGQNSVADGCGDGFGKNSEADGCGDGFGKNSEADGCGDGFGKNSEADGCGSTVQNGAADELFDWVFLDAAKGQYLAWLPDIMKVLRPGGMLITDNVLLEGSIAESKFSIERRDRTIHIRMREFLYELTHREDLETVILPVGDGVSLSVKA